MTEENVTASGRWLPIADAARRLGVSVRTVQRRIVDGRLEKRVAESGRHEIWVADEQANGLAPTERGGLLDWLEVTPQTTADPPETSVIVAYEQMTELYQRQLGTVREEVRTARRDGRVAWSVAAVLVVAGAMGLWWGTGLVTTQRAELQRMQERYDIVTGLLASAETTGTEHRSELWELRVHLASAVAERDALEQRVELLTREREAMLDELLATAIDRPLGGEVPVGQRTLAMFPPPPPAEEAAAPSGPDD